MKFALFLLCCILFASLPCSAGSVHLLKADSAKCDARAETTTTVLLLARPSTVHIVFSSLRLAGFIQIDPEQHSSSSPSSSVSLQQLAHLGHLKTQIARTNSRVGQKLCSLSIMLSKHLFPLLLLPSSALATLVATYPGGDNVVFKTGDDCLIKYNLCKDGVSFDFYCRWDCADADDSLVQTYNSVEIDLATGENLQMVRLSTDLWLR